MLIFLFELIDIIALNSYQIDNKIQFEYWV